MIRTAVLGATGRMGQALIRLIAASEDLQLVGAGTEPGHPDVGQDAGTLAGVATAGVPVTDQAAIAVGDAQVAIDFTLPGALTAHLEACLAAGSAMVIGTTGLSEDQQAQIEAAAASIGIVYGRNMSVGVNVLTALVRQAGQLLDADYDIEITEAHHRDKLDAPSGTALELGEAAAEARGTSLSAVGVFGRQGPDSQRSRGEIGINSLRAGKIVGEHRVLFASDQEQIELSHIAQDRDVFARGALHAARWLCHQKPGLYGMPQVLGLV